MNFICLKEERKRKDKENYPVEKEKDIITMIEDDLKNMWKTIRKDFEQ